ncbi:hypothetical protein [Actinoallomurus purpureus]|nr:hypothetical protein [Actinoallomurus purpureus]
MAVTQRLARLSGAEFDACWASVETLDPLCSFDRARRTKLKIP